MNKEFVLRTGMPHYVFKSENISQAQALLQPDKADPKVVIAGHNPSIVEFDFNTKQETRVAKIEDGKGDENMNGTLAKGHFRLVGNAEN